LVNGTILDEKLSVVNTKRTPGSKGGCCRSGRAGADECFNKDQKNI